jgi:sugar phosphate isomerase/epimerase
MDIRMTRRDLLSASALAPLAVSATKGNAPLGDVRPALYSITYLGYWYRGDALPMEQLIQRAKQFGYEGLEIEGKRPHGCPLDWPKRRCAEFRKRVADAGLAISGVAADNDFSSPISEHREAQLASVRDLIRMTSDLGTKVLRVFLAWTGATRLPDGGGRYDIAQKIWQYTREGWPEDQVWAWCRQGLADAARYAGDYGVTLALQNHRPIIRNHRQVLQMVREVNSPHLKVCLDAPLMEKRDPAYLRQAVLDAGALQVQTHFGGEYERQGPGQPIRIREVVGQWGGPYISKGYVQEDIYLPFIQALFETGYKGYIGYELCHPLPVVDGKTVGLDFADKSTRLAAEYIRGAIAEARKRAAGKA